MKASTGTAMVGLMRSLANDRPQAVHRTIFDEGWNYRQAADARSGARRGDKDGARAGYSQSARRSKPGSAACCWVTAVSLWRARTGFCCSAAAGPREHTGCAGR